MKKNTREAIKKMLNVKTPSDLKKLLNSFPEHAEYKPEITIVSPLQKTRLEELQMAKEISKQIKVD